MPHSLRAKLSSLRYKGLIEDKDYKRLCHALDLEKAEQDLTNIKLMLMEANINGYTEGLKDSSRADPCENCDHSEIIDWEQDTKTGKAKPIYYCEKHKESCDEVVSRQAVINLIRGCNSALEEPRIFDNHNAGVKFEQYVTELPSVRPQESTGHWIDMDEGFSPCECSVCETVEFKKSNYCPNCGARMESEETDG